MEIRRRYLIFLVINTVSFALIVGLQLAALLTNNWMTMNFRIEVSKEEVSGNGSLKATGQGYFGLWFAYYHYSQMIYIQPFQRDPLMALIKKEYHVTDEITKRPSSIWFDMTIVLMIFMLIVEVICLTLSILQIISRFIKSLQNKIPKNLKIILETILTFLGVGASVIFVAGINYPMNHQLSLFQNISVTLIKENYFRFDYSWSFAMQVVITVWSFITFANSLSFEIFGIKTDDNLSHKDVSNKVAYDNKAVESDIHV